jgi:hypothetical protein
VLVLLVTGLESLSYGIVGGVVDLIAMCFWTVLATLILTGFVTGRLIDPSSTLPEHAARRPRRLTGPTSALAAVSVCAGLKLASPR